jgi:hypothetical protein
LLRWIRAFLLAVSAGVGRAAKLLGGRRFGSQRQPRCLCPGRRRAGPGRHLPAGAAGGTGAQRGAQHGRLRRAHGYRTASWQGSDHQENYYSTSYGLPSKVSGWTVTHASVTIVMKDRDTGNKTLFKDGF